ncbi:MAG TPA: PilZ domain-containing protein [Pyrinomonadaceae bacterium]|nr:PilZ domain-containing protein [Pyrinomonadaceae bacterium]
MALDVAACKQSLGVRTVVEDLSAGGFSLRLAYPVEKGEKLLVITQVSQAVLLLRGEVKRVERQADDTYRLALSITRHQIFSSLAGEATVEHKVRS